MSHRGTAAGPAGPRIAVRSLPGLAVRLVRAWWPQVAALAAAAAIVAATITGGLGVGDATARGLRRLAVERLGRIDAAVVGTDFFTAGLVASLAARGLEDPAGPGRLVPAIVMEVTVEAAGGDRRAAAATLLACDDPAALGFEPPPPPLARGAVLLNEPLERAVGARPGDAVVLRLPRSSSVPADSPLGRRTAESTGRRLQVGAVLPEVGLGQFALRPAQVTRPLVVASLETARTILDRDDAVNAVFAVGGRAAASWLRSHLRPGLADVGLTLEPAAGSGGPRLTSRRLILPPEVDRAAAEVLGPAGGRPSLVFLANELRPLDAAGEPAAARVPYSTILGIDATNHPTGQLVDDAGHPLPLPGADEILIDRWLADDLAAQGSPVAVGDRIAVRFFLPETLHGRVEEASATFRIAGIAAMRGAAVARDLVPEVEGVSDEESIADWDPPFPFDAARVRTTPPHDEDDRYWKEHGTTPKAFIALAAARRIAGSRFGQTTAWHLPPGAVDPVRAGNELAARLEPEELGMRVVPLRDAALAAARGATPVGGLFLALSSFVVAAGLLLEWLLFDLLVAARGRDLGMLAAVGWPPRRLAALWLAVAGIAAAAGAVVGTLVGPLWSWGLLVALGRAWDADVAAGSARVFAVPPSWLAGVPGGLAALAVSLAAVAWSAGRAGRAAPWRLLKGPAAVAPLRPRGGWSLIVAALALALALATAFAGSRAAPAQAVAAFFVAGFLALAGLLAAVRHWLVARPRRPLASLAQLARRGLAHAAGRSFTVAAIVAVAQFLVVAVSSFAVRPPADPADRRGPTGGFATLAAFGAPTSVDPLDPEARAALGLTAAEERAVAGCTIERLRSSAGDDASCTNLYAVGRPTVLGVGPTFIARGGFAFAGHAALPAGTTNPWTLLARSDGGPVPAIVDQATAQWALKLGGVGAAFTIEDDAGRPVACEVVGLLAPGVLQGAVIVAERQFERIFPGRSGYGMALVDDASLPPAGRAAARAGLQRCWADAGATFTTALDRLRSLMAVQNTFLAGFQALGTLGLLLGTAGVAAVLLQGVLDRIGGLALLRAVGFTPWRIRRLLVSETIVAVGLGLTAGTIAGCLAVAPALAAATARVPLGWIAATCGLTLATAVVAAGLAATRAPIPERPGAAA
jgi:hypothetical protein